MNRKYSVIVFDLGNVLIPFTYNTAIQKLDKIDPGLGARFWDYYKNNYKYHRDFERGDIEEDQFITKMLGVLENKIDKETFCDLYSKIFTENKDVTYLLPQLKRNYILVLLSNTNSIHMKHGWGGYDFLKYFDKLILSHQIRAVKPEPKIYEAVENSTAKPASEHIFIDDIDEYINAAIQRGWDGITFHNSAQLAADLRSREIF